MIVSSFWSAAIASASLSEVSVAGSTRTRGVCPEKDTVVMPSPKNALSGRPLDAAPSLEKTPSTPPRTRM